MTTLLKFVITLVLGLAIAGVVGYTIYTKDFRAFDDVGTSANVQSVTVGNATYQVEQAVTSTQKASGLGGRASLGLDEGMLFSFEPPTTPAFWMKDMKFDIDIIWIKDGAVVDITERLLAQPYTPIDDLPKFSPNQDVNYALEVNAGDVEKYYIATGDKVDFLTY